MVPLDLPGIAQKLGVDANSIFGRLYHHLDPMYAEQNGKAGRKALFVARPGDEPDLINFPFLDAAFAGSRSSDAVTRGSCQSGERLRR